MVPIILQAAGAALLTLFAFAIWPPLVLLVGGLFLFLFGVAIEPSASALAARAFAQSESR